jgi:alpha-glucosidase
MRRRLALIESWWRRGVIYQIYPRSFQDATGDGVGDLIGIIGRLDHCVTLGVDALWLSPIYPSPMADFGYDIADYTNVDPLFGTLQEFDELLAAAKQRGLKMILDFVPNHTSDQHSWFKESRSSRASPKRDWYLWRDAAAGGGPPNNWLSHFGGSAWEWDPDTHQYYYHAFLKEQPDLNWRHPQVVDAMHDVLRFWLKRGVDGFRIDVLWLLIKDDQWRDNPANPDYQPGMPLFQSQLPRFNADRPEVQTIVAGLRAVADEFADRVLIGEIYLPLDRLMAYYGEKLSGIQMPFNFQLLQTPWKASLLAELIERYDRAVPHGAWPNWVLGNHDNPRIASRVGIAQARVAAMLLLTLRGTPTLYYGDELGMLNGVIPPDKIQDPLENRVPGKGLGRDPCRTPMQWDDSRFAGFSSHEPWLPISDDFDRVNVQAENNSTSMLALYRQLLRLRRAHPVLTVGSYQPTAATGDLLCYIRHAEGERFLIALNLGDRPCGAVLDEPGRRGHIAISTFLDRHGEACKERVDLRSNEGVIISLTGNQEPAS